MKKVFALFIMTFFVSACVLSQVFMRTPIPDEDAFAETKRLNAVFKHVAKKISPSVVSLHVKRINDEGQYLLVNGSGVVIRSDGLIITNAHVIDHAVEIIVILWNAAHEKAHEVACNTDHDLAVIQIECSDLVPAKFCNWNDVARGQWVIASGNPFGFAFDGQICISVGVVANLRRDIPEISDYQYKNMLQASAPISPGNSGGGLFNLDGELVGILTAMHKTWENTSISFAVPMDPERRKIVESMMNP